MPEFKSQQPGSPDDTNIGEMTLDQINAEIKRLHRLAERGDETVFGKISELHRQKHQLSEASSKEQGGK